ncbi:amidohydrolase, imidazolonepropionase [Novosphingobium sp. AP12]|nr:amidohydrolase, imidazolonepropionase [Novosphingobium sp. AP12]
MQRVDAVSKWLARSVILACMAPLPAAPVFADTLPPLAGRVIEYDTREVTWPALDLAPDGRTILFDLLGDIYALPPEGGKARPVMTGAAFDTQPVFSPDGRHIAFVSDRDGRENLWIADADGRNARRVSRDDSGVPHYSSPAWSPDGKTLYISRMIWGVLAFELWSFDAASGAGEVLVKAQPNGDDPHPQRRNAMGVVASPDGKSLYYAAKAGTTWTSGPLPHWTIARLDLAMRQQHAVVTTPGGGMRPVLSHDGRWLAYATREGDETVLRLHDLANGADRLLHRPLDPDGQSGGYYVDLLPRMVFSADDRSIYLGLGGGLKRLDVATGALADIPFEAHVRHEMAPDLRRQHRIDTGPVHVRVIQTPRLSPDGRQLVFGAVGRLYLAANRKGAKPRRLDVPGAAWQPSWSDDGRFVTYVTWTAKEGGHVWVAAVDGRTAPRRITAQAAYYSEPLFLAGGQDVVAFSASQHDRLYRSAESLGPMPSTLVRLPVDGGPMTLLGDVGAAMDLRRDADPARVRYYADGWISSHAIDPAAPGKEAARHLVKLVARPDSQYFNAPAPLKNAQLGADGRTALVRYASQLYLVPVPEAKQGEAPTVTVSDPASGARRITAIGADYMDWAPGMRSLVWSVGSTVRQLALSATTDGAPAAIEKRARSVPMDVALPRDVPRGSLLLRGARVATMKGDEVIDDADLLVVDNRIAGIGPRGTVKIPRGTEMRDVTGKFIVPGFIDSHAHWFETRRRILDIGHWDFAANLAYGVTAGLDVQAFDPDVFGYADMIDAGLMTGQRVFSTGEGVFRTSPMASREDAIATLRRYSDYYRTPNIKQYMVGDRAERRHLIEGAQALGLMPTTEGASDYRLDLTQMLDGYAGNEHSLPIAPIHDDLIQMLVRSRISTVPTMLVLYGAPGPLGAMTAGHQQDFDAKLGRFVPEFAFAAKRDSAQWNRADGQGFARFAQQASDIGSAGGLLGVGAHGIVQGLTYHWELEAMASGGASPSQVLHAATIGSAQVIGRVLDLGSIEPGKLADLLVLDRDPLADIRNTRSLEFVMQNGRLYDAATLDEQWPRRRPHEAQWFEGMTSREVAAAMATAAAFEEAQSNGASFEY